MSSVEFEKLRNKVAAASAVIVHQNSLIGEKDAKIAELEAKLTAAPAPVSPDIGDKDYAALSDSLDEAMKPALATNTNQPLANAAPAVDVAAFAPATTPAEPVSTSASVAPPSDVSYPGSDHPARA